MIISQGHFRPISLRAKLCGNDTVGISCLDVPQLYQPVFFVDETSVDKMSVDELASDLQIYSTLLRREKVSWLQIKVKKGRHRPEDIIVTMGVIRLTGKRPLTQDKAIFPYP